MVDANGQSLAYVYGYANQRDAGVANALTLDEARRIASNIAKLPTYSARNFEPTKPRRVTEEEDPVELPQARREARSN